MIESERANRIHAAAPRSGRRRGGYAVVLLASLAAAALVGAGCGGGDGEDELDDAAVHEALQAAARDVDTGMTSAGMEAARAAGDPLAQAQAIGRMAADHLGTRLAAALKRAVAEGGTKAAIDVCSVNAPSMTETLSAEHGVVVRRVSERYRNPADAPDEVEQAVLQRFAAADAPPDTVFVAGHAGDPPQPASYLYMRPIRIGKPLCLKCHGDAAGIEPDVLARIQALYPDDRALDYAFRDLRGAFSVAIPASVLAPVSGSAPASR